MFLFWLLLSLLTRYRIYWDLRRVIRFSFSFMSMSKVHLRIIREGEKLVGEIMVVVFINF